MNSYKLSAAVFAVAALGTSAFAQNPAGKWTGHIQMAMPPIPANTPPQQRTAMMQGMAMVKKMVITLVMKSNKTYEVSVKGGMVPADKAQDSGKWSQKGHTITMTSSKSKGNHDSQAGNLSADGKTLTIVPPTHGGPATKIIFKKG